MVSRMDLSVASMFFFSLVTSRSTTGTILWRRLIISYWACWYSKRQNSLWMKSGLTTRMVRRLFSTASMMLLAMAAKGES